MAARKPQPADKPKRTGQYGQPTKYRPDCCDIAIAKGQEGASKTEIAVACGASRKTLDYWRDKHPEFEEAMTLAEMHAQVWWEQKGRDLVTGVIEKGSATAFIFQMKNRFRADYPDRVEHTGKDGAAITLTLSKDDAAL